MSDPISTMYFHNMFCDLLNKILFKPKRHLGILGVCVCGGGGGGGGGVSQSLLLLLL